MPHYLQIEVDAQLLKMLRRKSKAQFVKQERNTQNSIVLLKYLKRIAPQQLMLRMQVFTKIFLKRKERKRDFLNKKVGFQMISMICRIRTWVSRFSSTGLNHHAIRAKQT
jgi:hypothetical protein